MSKGLEALKEIKDFAKNEWEDKRFDFAIIEKELKALEIIKTHISPLGRYSFLPMNYEDFTLISEVLDNDN